MRTLTTLLMLLVASCGAPAYAQESNQQDTGVCNEYKAHNKILEENYGETSIFTGISYRETLIKLYYNEKTYTWTIVEVTPEGVACTRTEGTYGVTEEYDPTVLDEKG